MANNACKAKRRHKYSGNLPGASLFALCILTGSFSVAAQETTQEQADLSLLLEMVQQQGEELKQQRALLEAQNKKILELQQQIDGESTSTAAEPALAKSGPLPASSIEPDSADDQSPVLTAEKSGLPALPQEDVANATESESERAETVSFVNYDKSTFAGAFLIPNTETALRIGGRVKANVVQSFNSVGSQDRFIVGTIPTTNDSADNDRQSEAALTVQQSRLNFEVRQNSGIDQVRAYIEGDFSGDDDTFKLRHAFGQYRSVLAGKTWTAFMDTEASPEEVDFEGLNSRTIVRQTQLRYFPSIRRTGIWQFRWKILNRASPAAPVSAKYRIW